MIYLLRKQRWRTSCSSIFIQNVHQLHFALKHNIYWNEAELLQTNSVNQIKVKHQVRRKPTREGWKIRMKTWHNQWNLIWCQCDGYKDVVCFHIMTSSPPLRDQFHAAVHPPGRPFNKTQQYKIIKTSSCRPSTGGAKRESSAAALCCGLFCLFVFYLAAAETKTTEKTN